MFFYQFHRNGKTSTTDLRYYSTRYIPAAFTVQNLPTDSRCSWIDFQNFTSLSPMSLDKEDTKLKEFILQTTAQCPCTGHLAFLQSQNTQTPTSEKSDTASQYMETKNKISQTIISDLIDKVIQIEEEQQTQQKKKQQTEPCAHVDKSTTSSRKQYQQNPQNFFPQMESSDYQRRLLVNNCQQQQDQDLSFKCQQRRQPFDINTSEVVINCDCQLHQKEQKPGYLTAPDYQQAASNYGQQEEFSGVLRPIPCSNFDQIKNNNNHHLNQQQFQTDFRYQMDENSRIQQETTNQLLSNSHEQIKQLVQELVNMNYQTTAINGFQEIKAEQCKESLDQGQQPEKIEAMQNLNSDENNQCQQNELPTQNFFGNCYCPSIDRPCTCQKSQTNKPSTRRKRVSCLSNSDSSNESDIEDYLCNN